MNYYTFPSMHILAKEWPLYKGLFFMFKLHFREQHSMKMSIKVKIKQMLVSLQEEECKPRSVSWPRSPFSCFHTSSQPTGPCSAIPHSSPSCLPCLPLQGVLPTLALFKPCHYNTVHNSVSLSLCHLQGSDLDPHFPFISKYNLGQCIMTSIYKIDCS